MKIEILTEKENGVIKTKKMKRVKTIVINCNDYHRDGRLKAIGEAIVAIRQIRGKRYYADILDTTEWFESVSELRKNKPHAIIVA